MRALDERCTGSFVDLSDISSEDGIEHYKRVKGSVVAKLEIFRHHNWGAWYSFAEQVIFEAHSTVIPNVV